jgi:cytochrome c oxidase subunit 2
MNKFIGLFIISLLMVGGIILFNQNKPLLKKEEVSKQAATTSSNSVKEFTLTAKNWTFNPSVITVKQGDKVKLNVKSIDVSHGFALPDYGFDQKLEPGKEIIIEFIASKKGEFTFFCSVLCGEGHKDMKGKLVVE